MSLLIAHTGDFHWYTAVIYLGPILGVMAWLGIGSVRDRRRAARPEASHSDISPPDRPTA